MAREIKEIVEFGPFRLDPAEALLTRLGTTVPLPPKVFDLLVCFVSNPGRLLEKDELLKTVWPESFVEEANLTVNVAALRRALGSQPDGQPWIETVPKRGYRFLGVVSHPIEPPPPSAEPAPAPAPENPPRRPRPILYGAAALAVVVAAVATYLYFRGAVRPSSTRPPQSIAVLPFQDLSSLGDEAHTGLGMTDALITKLGAVPELTVRPIVTVRKYEESAFDPLQAGRDLRVDTVLTGSVQRLDKRIRVSVRLLRVQDGRSLWADKFDEFYTNLFAVQDAISEKLAGVLALRLTSEELNQMMRRYTESTEAFRLYELGRYERSTSMRRGVDYYQMAIREDPRYALPHIELVDIYLGLAGNGDESYRRNAPLARDEAATALRLAPDLAEAHVASADLLRAIDRNYPAAAREIDAALHLNPQSAKAHHSRGLLLAIQGQLQPAITEELMALNLDPFNSQFADDVSWILYCSRQYQAALARLDEFKLRDPRPRTDWNRFYCYLMMSRVQDAIDLIQASIADASSRTVQSFAPFDALLARAYAMQGNAAEARKLLAALPDAWGYYQRAAAELALGDRDAALAHLDRAVDEHSVWIEWIKVDPTLDPLHGDPRFHRIVARLGLEP